MLFSKSLRFTIHSLLSTLVFLTLASCLPQPTNVTPADARVEAMKKVAQQDPACKALGNFYWSVGDQSGRIGQGQIGSQFGANTSMAIFSASKWIFSTYVLQKTGGSLTTSLIQGLNFTSGYIGGSEKICNPADTVGSCYTRELSTFNASKVGTFVYGSGHMQKIAAQDLGLAALDRNALATEVMSVLGTDIVLGYDAQELGLNPGPILAGAVKLAPTSYEKMLTKMVAGQYEMKNFLGSNATPTGMANIKYSLGHWVEPDGSFHSVGAAGFYPWVDSTKTVWGVIARVERDLAKLGNAPAASQACGQKMRAAFLSTPK